LREGGACGMMASMRGGDLWRRLVPACAVAALVSVTTGGCGSSSPRPSIADQPLSRDATPLEIVRRAFLSLGSSSYDETVTDTGRVDTSRLPRAEAARIQAVSASINTNEAGTASITNFNNLRLTVRTPSGSIYIRASKGKFSGSRDGVNYQPIPASQAADLVNIFEGAVTAYGKYLTDVKDVGPRHVGTTAVEEYQATLPGRVVRGEVSSITAIVGKSAPTGLSYGPVTETLDVDRSTGFPVSIATNGKITFALASLHRRGVSGSLVVINRSTRGFSHFRPH
jgi:hypothetical protein